MTTCDQMSLTTEVLSKLNIKDHMAIDPLITKLFKFVGVLLLRRRECNTNICHLLLDCIGPECVPVFLVNLVRLLNRLWHMYNKFMGSLPVLGLDLRNDSIQSSWCMEPTMRMLAHLESGRQQQTRPSQRDMSLSCLSTQPIPSSLPSSRPVHASL